MKSLGLRMAVLSAMLGLWLASCSGDGGTTRAVEAQSTSGTRYTQLIPANFLIDVLLGKNEREAKHAVDQFLNKHINPRLPAEQRLESHKGLGSVDVRDRHVRDENGELVSGNDPNCALRLTVKDPLSTHPDKLSILLLTSWRLNTAARDFFVRHGLVSPRDPAEVRREIKRELNNAGEKVHTSWRCSDDRGMIHFDAEFVVPASKAEPPKVAPAIPGAVGSNVETDGLTVRFALVPERPFNFYFNRIVRGFGPVAAPPLTAADLSYSLRISLMNPPPGIALFNNLAAANVTRLRFRDGLHVVYEFSP